MPEAKALPTLPHKPMLFKGSIYPLRVNVVKRLHYHRLILRQLFPLIEYTKLDGCKVK